MFYIQRYDNQTKRYETVDEFTTRKEALAMQYEYALSDYSALYYISTRSCNAWREKQEWIDGFNNHWNKNKKPVHPVVGNFEDWRNV